MTPPEILARVSAVVEPQLAAALADPDVPPELAAAMRHAVLGAGKRLRPALVIGAAEACGRSDAVPALVPAACSLELLHAYSLIHDDLPAMDNADTRRGKPSCHRAFGEAGAILAGDALQALAFSELVRPVTGVAPAAQLAAVAELARAAGPAGMCGGQALDLDAVRRPPDAAGLVRLQAMKTGALIRAAARIGALLAGASGARLAAVGRYGEEVGAAFQIADDVLDVVGSGAALGKATGGDAAGGKPTVAARYGVDEARRLAAAAAERAVAALAGFGAAAAPLRELARFAAARDR